MKDKKKKKEEKECSHTTIMGKKIPCQKKDKIINNKMWLLSWPKNPFLDFLMQASKGRRLPHLNKCE